MSLKGIRLVNIRIKYTNQITKNKEKNTYKLAKIGHFRSISCFCDLDLDL